MTRTKKPRGQARRTKKAQLQAEYNRELKNLKGRIRGYKNRGYYFEKDIIPQSPKRITTASINKIRNIRGSKLLKQGNAIYIDVETGELLTVKQHKERQKHIRKIKALSKKLPSVEDIEKTVQNINVETYIDKELSVEQKEQEKIPSFSSIIINNYLNNLRGYSSAPMYDKLMEWFNTMLNNYGEDDTAIMLYKGAEAGHVITREVAYYEDQMLEYVSAMTKYMPEMTEQFVKDFMEAFEEGEGESYLL